MTLRSAHFLLIASFGLFATFFANVVAGAFASTTFLSDVGELIVLFASCIFFVAATLQIERDRIG